MTEFLFELSRIVLEHEPLAPHTSFGLGGAARWLARPRSTDQVALLVRRCGQEGIPHVVLGLGANVLVSDEGLEGMVLRLNAPEFRQVAYSDGTGTGGRSRGPRRSRNRHVTVIAGAGADMHRLVLESVRRGLRGLEVLAGIPATLGGAIRMNAGGREGQIADVVRELTVVDTQGSVKQLSRSQVGFGYRSTRLDGTVICQAKLELTPDDPTELRDRFLAIWDHKKRSQPLNEQSAGCVFKNPPALSAGALIDRAGLKGRSVGGAHVSEVHANFIVAKEGATAGDVFTLIGQIRREVAQQFGVELELEIEIWGRQHTRNLEPIL